jgi:hypothetical protein
MRTTSWPKLSSELEQAKREKQAAVNLKSLYEYCREVENELAGF